MAGQGRGTTLSGVEVGISISAAEKTWRMFRALGDIAFAYTYSQILIEIQVNESKSFTILFQSGHFSLRTSLVLLIMYDAEIFPVRHFVRNSYSFNGVTKLNKK